jgi:hypothetical protein
MCNNQANKKEFKNIQIFKRHRTQILALKLYFRAIILDSDLFNDWAIIEFCPENESNESIKFEW